MPEERFGFTVQRPKVGSPWDDDPVRDGEGWVVFLPHQCSKWDIAGEDGLYGVPHAEAVAALERFVAEAQVALAALRAEREVDGE